MEREPSIAATRITPLRVAVQAELPASCLQRIAELPGVMLHSRTELAERPELLDEAEVLLTLHTEPERIARAPALRWVQAYSAGIDRLLTEEILARSDLCITNARGVHAQPIAEHVFGMMLMFVRRLDGALLQQQERIWKPRRLYPTLRTLAGATLSVLGLGSIGRRIAEVGAAFGMRIAGSRRGGEALPGIDRVYRPDQLFDLLSESDYVVNSLPLTRETRNLLGESAFAAMRRGSVLVNIGRGASVDTDALVAALRSEHLGGALLDVTEPEPLPPDHALYTFSNVLISPHYAGAHPAYAEQLTTLFVNNLRRYMAGAPLENQVDKRAGY